MSTNTVGHPIKPYLRAGLTALGSSQATALQLTNNTRHEFTTVASSTGAILPIPVLPSEVSIFNDGANALAIYPPIGGTINAGTVNAPISLAAGSAVTYWASSMANWYSLQSGGSSAGGLSTSAAYTVFGNNTPTASVPTAISSLIVGAPSIADTGVFQQWTGSVVGYEQTILQNTSNAATASTDLVLNNDQGTANTHFINVGINSSGYTGTGSLNIPGAGYVLVTTGDLVFATSGSNAMHFLTSNATTDALTINAAGNLVVPAFNSAGIVVNSAAGVLSSTAALTINSSGNPVVPAFTTAGIVVNSAAGVLSSTAALTINSSGSPVVPAFTTAGIVVNSAAGVLSSATLASQLPAFTGAITTTAGSSTTSFSTIPSHTLLANTTASAASPSGVTLTSLIDTAIDNTPGDLLYRNASAWTQLPAGATVGGLLTTGGASGNPSWTTKVASGTDGNLSFGSLSHSSVSAGDLWYPSSDQGTFSIGRASGQARLGGCIFSCGPCTAVSNSNSQASIFGSPTNSKGSLTIPANTLAVGNVLRWYMTGIYSASSSTPNLSSYLLLNGTAVLVNLASASFSAAQTNAPFYNLTGFLNIQAIGTSASAGGLSWIECVTASAAQVGTTACPGGNTAPVGATTFNSTTNALFDIKFQWSAASASNSFQLQSFQLFLEN